MRFKFTSHAPTPFSFLGTPVRIYPTAALAIVSLILWQVGNSAGTLQFLLVLLALFGLLLIHELAHITAAFALGIKLREAAIDALGGQELYETVPKPKSEILLALAGPLAHGIIWLLLLPVEQLPIVHEIALLNIFLGLINLLPAPPLDGGRILKCVLRLNSRRKPHAIVSRVGIGVSIILSGIVLLYLPEWALALPIFLGLSGFSEYMISVTDDLAGLLTVKDTMIPRTRLRTLSHATALSEASKSALTESYEFFPVVNGGEILGIIEREQLIRSGATGVTSDYVLSITERNLPEIDGSKPLSEALELFHATAAGALIVTDGDGCVGFLREKQVVDAVLLAEGQRLAKISIEEP
jgi:Zn-dependent protease/CBS domain-containing protein